MKIQVGIFLPNFRAYAGPGADCLQMVAYLSILPDAESLGSEWIQVRPFGFTESLSPENFTHSFLAVIMSTVP